MFDRVLNTPLVSYFVHKINRPRLLKGAVRRLVLAETFSWSEIGRNKSNLDLTAHLYLFLKIRVLHQFSGLQKIETDNG